MKPAGADPHQLWFECLGPDHAEDELEMVDVGDQEMAEAMPPTFAISAFAEEEEDDFASSVSDTSGSGIRGSPPHMSPLVMAMAAERVGLPLPTPLPETSYPGVPPLDESLATHLLPQAAGWAENLCPATAYFDRILRLGAQMAAAANNTGVLGVSLIAPPQDAPTSAGSERLFGPQHRPN